MLLAIRYSHCVRSQIGFSVSSDINNEKLFFVGK